MKATTFLSRAAAGLVAAVAGFASYQHIYDVATGAGEHRSVAGVLPLAIDGLILVATLAMLDDKRNGRRPRMSARVALVFGVLSTLAANIASANPTTTARLVAAVPAVSFLLAVEVLARVGKPARTELAADVPAPAGLEVFPAETPAGPDEPAAMVTAEPTSEPAKTRPHRATPKTLTAADKVARVAAKMPDATNAELARKAGVSESTVKRHRPKLPTVAEAAANVGADPAVIADAYAAAGFNNDGTPTGSPSTPDAAETATVPAVNGQPVELAEVTR